MDDEAAAAEQEAMAEAVKTKFEGKVFSWLKGGSLWRGQMKVFSHQSLSVNSYQEKIDKKHVLKGTAAAKAEKGWAFSVILTDRAMHDYVAKAPENNGGVPDGVDAL